MRYKTVYTVTDAIGHRYVLPTFDEARDRAIYLDTVYGGKVEIHQEISKVGVVAC